MLLGPSTPLDLTVGEYVLISGMSRTASAERAALTLLGDPYESLTEFIDRLGADEFPFGIVETYVDTGAFASPVFYPALTALRRAHPEARSLVRRTRDGLERRAGNDSSVREEQAHEIGGGHEADTYWRQAMRSYIGSLTPAKREKFHQVLTAAKNRTAKQHL